MFIKCKFLPVLFILFLLLAGEKIAAQPFSLDERVQPLELVLKDFDPEDSLKKGRMSIVSIEQNEDTMYFFVKGISIYSPLYIGITGDSICGALKISLHTENWHKADQSGTTDDKRHWETKFKTEGDFGIMVIAPAKPSSYSIIVWNGKDIRPEMPSPFINMDKSSGGGSIFSGNKLLIGGLALLAVIIAFLIYKRKNHKNEK